MSLTTPRILLIVVVVAAFVLGLLISRWLHRRRETIWQRFARRQRLGFQWDEDQPLVVGRTAEGDFRLEVSRESSDSGELGLERVRMSLAPRQPPRATLDVRSMPAGLAEITEELEEYTLVTGDEAFDAAFCAADPDVQAAAAQLTPPRRQALLRLAERTPDDAWIGIADGRLLLEQRHLPQELPQLEASYRLLKEAAAAWQ